jgi:rhodanese-related sulfurtransferase
VALSSGRHTLDELLQLAAARIERYAPEAAAAAMRDGALLVDIRADLDRERDGIVPGSLHIPRTVLEWRTAPESAWRNPYVGDVDQPVILLCDHGCSSVFAAEMLVELGFERAGDVIGGYAAWCDAGLPTTTAPQHRRAAGDPAGMGPPAPY